MNRVLVIADDLTGAAEIAGVGMRFGMAARIVREPHVASDAPLTVIDTDSRLLPPADAARVVQEFASAASPERYELIFKKTDSALRGNVRAEIEAMLETTARTAALLIPQNPSRGRIIRGGDYYIDGVPLDQTAFAGDPDHPAHSANAIDLLGRGTSPISIADAVNVADVRRLASSAVGAILPAGGADFFQAILEARGARSVRQFDEHLHGDSALFICGSASAYSRELESIATQHRIPVVRMPDHANTADIWSRAVLDQLSRSPRVLMTIGIPKIDSAFGAGQRLQTALAETVARVLDQTRIANLLIEGGATASAVCRRMTWNEFEVESELAPGIVRLRCVRPLDQHLVIKPGSYPWPPFVWPV